MLSGYVGLGRAKKIGEDEPVACVELALPDQACSRAWACGCRVDAVRTSPSPDEGRGPKPRAPEKGERLEGPHRPLLGGFFVCVRRRPAQARLACGLGLV